MFGHDQPIPDPGQSDSEGFQQVFRGQNVSWRTVCHNSAGQQHDAVTCRSFGDIVSGNHDSSPSSLFLSDHLEVGRTAGSIEACRRLVQENQLRPAGEHLRKPDTLALTTGQISQCSLCEVFDLHRVHGVLDKFVIVP
jgi:hypothetical protein